MKTKIFLSILCFILLVSLIGMVVADSAWPQGVGDLIWVKFAGDPMQQHGRQVWSYCVYTDGNQYDLVYTVPSQKRLIITEITTEYICHLYLSKTSDGSEKKLVYNSQQSIHLGYHSGITFEADESIYLRTPGVNGHVTLSGYFVDMP